MSRLRPRHNNQSYRRGKVFVANIIAISALVGITNVVKFESLKHAVLNRFPKGTENINHSF
ncbi:MAG: hypothetical protein ACOYVD_17165 [Bacillota bacterium]